ncbi:MAG: flagellin [Selenomonas sp.]|uniref:flagellin n=1 Tax=Selenomonas sp. TaxID=2053611 RepID=UPI0025FF26C0|nr:flagellin [Selenomonas sp.]MCR5438399.1 flagellin [Selenomonas sp.]
MAMTLMNNATTMMTLGELNKNITKANSASKKLASGMRLNSAADGASEYAISEKMRVCLRSLNQDDQNIQNGRSLVKVGLGGMEEIKHSIEQMKELALGAANDTMTDEDRATSQKVLNHMIDNIDDIATGTTFNGIHVLMPMGKNSDLDILPADFVFVVDITGSMGGHISSVASKVGGFASYLRSINVDANFALVSYGDCTADPPSSLSGRLEHQRFGDDVDAFSSALDTLASSVTGGGDMPESGLEAIMDSTDGALAYEWREDAMRHVVVITDADVHDSDDTPITGSGTVPASDWYSVSDVVDALNADSVKAHVISNRYREWEEITSGTGGEYYSISSDYEISLRDLAKTLGESFHDNLRIQTGTKANENILVQVYDHRANALGLRTEIKKGEWENIKINPREAAVASLAKIDKAMNKVLGYATTWGSYAQRMDQTQATTVTNAENTQASESIIRDADMAKEMAEYTKNNVLSQAAQSMLAQANQNTSSVLSLLQ